MKRLSETKSTNRIWVHTVSQCKSVLGELTRSCNWNSVVCVDQIEEYSWGTEHCSCDCTSQFCPQPVEKLDRNILGKQITEMYYRSVVTVCFIQSLYINAKIRTMEVLDS